MVEINLIDHQTSEKEKEREIRELLPFWAREVLKMAEEAERMHKAPASSSRGGA